MIADGRNYPRSDPWGAILPRIAVVIVRKAGNFPGDWLWDRFDPRMRQTFAWSPRQA